MVVFNAAFFREAGNPANKIPLCTLAVALDVVNALLASSCFTIFSVLTDCVGFGLARTNFEGCAGFDFLFFHADFFNGLLLRMLNIRRTFPYFEGGTSGSVTSEAFMDGFFVTVSFDATFPDEQGLIAVVASFGSTTSFYMWVSCLSGVTLILRWDTSSRTS